MTTKLQTGYFRVAYTQELEDRERVWQQQTAIALADSIRDGVDAKDRLAPAIRLHVQRIARRYGVCGWCHMMHGEHSEGCEIGAEIFEAQRLTQLHETPPEELP